MATIFSSHALKRMFERSVSTLTIEHVLEHGQVIQVYPDDQPYPSRLVLGFVGTTPLHVVAANTDVGDTVVITAYVPDTALWDNTFTRRRT